VLVTPNTSFSLPDTYKDIKARFADLLAHAKKSFKNIILIVYAGAHFALSIDVSKPLIESYL